MSMRTLPARLLAGCLLASLSLALPAQAIQPIVTDSRIKTFVYNPNEVFNIVTEYGYQSNIEFGENETIDTVSVGDRVSWQIIPAGRRLFIRAMEENAHTNMTIVTNRRAYQFDLRATNAAATIGSERLVYVIRFYYPGEPNSGPAPASYSGAIGLPPAPAPLAVAYTPPTPVTITSPSPITVNVPPPASTPLPVSTGNLAPVAAAEPVNYRYTYSGPNTIAPVKIYDDGKSTYFKFRGAPPQSFSVITATGEEMRVPAHNAGPDLVAVDVIAPRFSLRRNGQQVVVYNESSGA